MSDTGHDAGEQPASENHDVEEREAEVARRAAAVRVQAESVGRVLEAARARDEVAERRDDAALERDRVAGLDAFTRQEGPFTHDLDARRRAALDRHHSRHDRSSAADDRAALTETPDHRPAPGPGSEAHHPASDDPGPPD